MSEPLDLGAATLPPLGDVLDFLRFVWAVDQRLQSVSKRMEAELGVTSPQRMVIRLVGRFPGITPSQLAELLRIHRSTLTGVVKRLEARKLISRRRDPLDGRRSFLGLTPRGRKLDVEAPGTVEAAVAQVLKQLPKQKVAVGREVLAALAEALKDPREDEE